MNINKECLAIVGASSDDDTRYALQSLYFDTDGVVATDGAMLAKLTYPTQIAYEDLPTNLPLSQKEPLKPFLLPSSAIPQIARSIPKMRRMPILENLYLDVDKTNENGSAFFATTDLQQVTKPEIKKIDAEFPPYQRVFPTKNPTVEIGLSANLLKKIGDIATKAGCIGLKVSVYSGSDPIKLEGKNEEGQEFTALVMPMRI